MNGDQPTLTAVLFAGGQSRRMGMDKATLVVGGEPLWSRQLRTLRELTPQTIFVSVRNAPAWCPSDALAICDEAPSRGPLSGLVAALERTETTHLLALAIDLPLMTSSHLMRLWSLVSPGMGVIPQNGTYFEPLVAIYPVAIVAAASKALAQETYSLQDLARRLVAEGLMRTYLISEPEKSNYENVNTPDLLDHAVHT
jgi:molybdopterin-guanine dinucleotide biosynthesis protein A